MKANLSTRKVNNSINGGSDGNWTRFHKWQAIKFYSLVLSFFYVMAPNTRKDMLTLIFCHVNGQQTKT